LTSTVIYVIIRNEKEIRIKLTYSSVNYDRNKFHGIQVIQRLLNSHIFKIFLPFMESEVSSTY